MIQLPKAKRLEFIKCLLSWWSQNRRSYPWREEGITAYKILIAEVLLKRTTASAAVKSYTQMIKEFDSVEKLAHCNQIRLEKILLAVGLQNQRSRGLKEIATYLCNRAECQIPCDYDSLVEIPHVGPYTANAIQSFAYDIPKAVVDSNVVRSLRRCFYAQLKTEKRLRVFQEVADNLLPGDRHKDFNWAMLDFGAIICRYAHPLHNICPLRHICTYPRKD